MTAIIENLTSHPSREVERLVRFALREQEADDRALAVRVKNGAWGVSGRYYPLANSQGAGFYSNGEYREVRVQTPPGCSYLITVKLPSSFPQGAHYYSRAEVPPETVFENWQEALVWVSAHEAKHHWQWRNRRKRASGRRRFQFKETECDFAAYRTLRKWRQR